MVGDLGDRTLMVAGEGWSGTGLVAYGVTSSYARRETSTWTMRWRATRVLVLRARWSPDWLIWLPSALTVGDQNGDGRRDLGLVVHSCGTDNRLLVAYAPAFGTSTLIGDLGAADERGYAMRPSWDVADVGDQNGDGRSDIATASNVYFTDPARETGEREPTRAGSTSDGARSWGR